MTKARGGRRPGASGTREQILASAKRLFGERGYDAATVREIATDAGVDPAMINHHFGNKEQLFMETIAFPVDPRDHIPGVLAGPPEELAERLLRMFLTLWDSPAGTATAAILRTAVQHDWSVKLLRQFLLVRVIRPILSTVEPDEARAAWRGSLVASQMVGLMMVRYILKFEPLASAPREVVLAAIAPTVQRYFTGDVPPTPPA